ncbi:hypothetical protein SAMN02745227_02137 [Anaerobranca californiensis DSM 14826]|jgi:hypothetical protein|uniref:Transcriptional regulator n=1 Tax=Anaerobranca californiensis DSM 14826 TaxID=1120989 RepID=A0A1M6RYV4_9FIRM|nr:transcriptional regulator [Anaerobranca californiensis]SHK37489.1 hypothetical protein SAMN02745227_02137 [Anaerobranca californiensis DSM 14826]
MDFYKINDKTISREKIIKYIDKILTMRSLGHSQAEVASLINTDRTFISRIESLGEVRKGKTIALVGFPIGNAQEVKNLAQKYGVNYVFLLSEKERWEFLVSKTGLELFDQLINIVGEIRKYDTVILMGSDMRIKVLESLLDNEVIGINIGESPIRKDVYIDLEYLDRVLQNIV